ncbi:hypothetical protein DFH05DRAFT_1559873 [Lentinula detonsa]|uniref:Uncharacterized protein n=1 Tax=Lentinula detonsa TaxID=2804962 RepID=A0A9W8TTG1_9AGAR|nr:hypothetical protein DFH05DRAFT_1559873 [Lentinula detonsa]
MINTILETFPFIGTVLISQIHENSGWIQSWFSIIPMGFWKRSSVTDHAYCTTCTYMPLVLDSVRGKGQVGGVAISSTIFQWKLDGALRKRIDGPDVEQVGTDRIGDRDLGRMVAQNVQEDVGFGRTSPALQLQLSAVQAPGFNDPIILNVQVHNTNSTVYNFNNAQGDVNHTTNNDGFSHASFNSK